MASSFLKNKAQSRAKIIDQEYGPGAYGGSEWRKAQSSTPSMSSRNKTSSSNNTVFDKLFSLANEAVSNRLSSAPRFTLPTTTSGIVKRGSSILDSTKSMFDISDLERKQEEAASNASELNRQINFARRSRDSSVNGMSIMDAQKELNQARDTVQYFNQEVGKYDRLNRLRNTTQSDDFLGQFWANYDMGQLGQDEGLAWAAYLDNPTEANRNYAEAVSITKQDYMGGNAGVLDDEGAVLPWVTQDLAQYLPQFVGQNIAGAKGAFLGGAAGSVIPVAGTASGVKAGYVAGRATYGYDTMRGIAFKSLIDSGVDEETARAAASDEALISSLIEGGDAALDLLTLGGGKLIGAAFKTGSKAGSAITKSTWKKLLSGGASLLANAAGEGAQEWVQEGVSLANQKRGDSGLINLAGESVQQIYNALSGNDPDALAQMNESAATGFRIGLMAGGGSMLANNAIARAVNRADVIQQANSNLSDPEFVQRTTRDAVDMVNQNLNTRSAGGMAAPRLNTLEQLANEMAAERMGQMPWFAERTQETTRQPTASGSLAGMMQQQNTTAPTQAATQPTTQQAAPLLERLRQQTNVLSNRQAEQVLADQKAMETLRKSTGLSISNQSTGAAKRSAVKQAFSQYAAAPIETAQRRQGVQVPIEERTWQDAGNRKVNAFQYDHPELHPYFVEAARSMKYDLSSAVKGERIPVMDDSSGYKEVTGYTGTKRSVTGPIEHALDDANLSYAQIEKALDDLIADQGQENYAAAKKVELVLDEMLSNGYTDSDGYEVPPNTEYLAAREQISMSGGIPNMSEEEWNSIMGQEPEEAIADNFPQQLPVQEQAPAQQQTTPEQKPVQPTASKQESTVQSTPSDTLRKELSRQQSYSINGFTYKIEYRSGAGYTGIISGDNELYGGMVRDARDKIYISNVLGSRQEAIEDLVEAANFNGLLESAPKKNPVETPKKTRQQPTKKDASKISPGGVSDSEKEFTTHYLSPGEAPPLENIDPDLYDAQIKAAEIKYGISADESTSLQFYVSGAAYEWTKLQRTTPESEWSDYIKRAISYTMEGVRKLPVYQGRTYRNLTFKTKDSYDAFLQEHSRGSTVTLKSLTSSSKNPNGYIVGGNYVVHMIIDSVSGHDMSESYSTPNQQEVIFLPGVKLKVTELTSANDGKVLIYTREENEIGQIISGYSGQSETIQNMGRNDEGAKGSRTRIRHDPDAMDPRNEGGSGTSEEGRRVPFQQSRSIYTGRQLKSNEQISPQQQIAYNVKAYLGRVIPPSQIDGVLRGLGSNRTKKTYTPKQISSAVLDDGKEAVLQDNRMKIVRRKVSGEWRMEITGQNLWYLPRQINGIISERISYEYRYFIPTGENGERVLRDLIEINPVVDIRSGAPEEVDQMVSPEEEKGAEKWTAARVGSTDKKPQPLSDLIEKIQHDFGINITTGHIRGSGTLGQYNRRDQGIRSKVANDLPTVAHELGHHLDNVYGLTKNLDSVLLNELVDNMDESMRNAYKKKKWPTEGLAEFVRKFLQNRETAAIDYPKFTEYFLSSMSNTDGPMLEQLADEVNAYYSLDADTATSSIRMSEEGGRDFRTLREKIKDAGDAFYQAWVDSNHGIKLFSKAAENPAVYRMASNAAYSDAVAGQILIGDLTDRNGQYVGPGLKTALHGINLKNKKEYRLFGEYLVVKHGPERLKEGMRVFADDRKNSSNFMEARQIELEQQYPEFKAASERLYAFQESFLQTWGVSTGLVSADSAKKWSDRWEFYVPFNRAIDKTGRPGARRGFANQSSGIRKAIGSGLDIVNPVDNIIYNVVRMVNAGTRNNVMTNITRAAEKSGGMASFLEKVPMPLKRTSFDAKGLKETLKQGITDSSMTEEDKDSAFDLVDNIDDILYQYGRGKAKGNVITVMKSGKPEYWKINDDLLLDSITGMSPAKLPAILEAYGSISRFMTSNLTGNNVLWSIFSNTPRDLMTFFTYSKSKNPFKLLGNVGAAYANRLKGQNADPLYKEYLAMGGGKSSVYTADRSLAKRTRRSIAGSKLDYINPMEWISFVSDTVEMGPRFAYYKILRQKGISPQKAFYESSDITVNFRRGGSSARTLNRFIPFFNASVQGLDKFSRWIRAQDVVPSRRGKAVAARLAAYIMASLALAALIYGLNNQNDEDKKNYQQLSNYTKNSYWCIPTGDGKFLTIPKPREIAVLSSFFETAMEYFHGDNQHAFDEFYSYVAENFLPSVLSDVAKADLYGAIGSLGIIGVGSYMMANRDFLGNPIVSSGLQALEPRDQYTERTSQIAKSIGSAFNVSPQMVDYFFQQTLGGWWKAQKALFPVGEAEIDPTMGIMGTYIRDSQYSTDLVNWMYDKADASARAKSSDPENIQKAVDSKWDSNMTSFYSRYYAVAKTEPETTSTRATRQTVLDMILEYQKAYDAGEKTALQKKVESICIEQGDTKYMPTVVQQTIKDEAGNAHSLSASQYVEYQTDYLRIYWDTVEEALPNASNKKERAAAVWSAKSLAEEVAKNRALKRIGASYDSTYLNTSVDLGDIAWFDSVYDNTSSDKDENGKTISGSKQDKVIQALEEMNLTDQERSYLFGTKYTSDKNNPWA